MIGRFLLGAGLGGLVGTGLLVLASVTLPHKSVPSVPALTDVADQPAPQAAAAPDSAETAATEPAASLPDAAGESPPQDDVATVEGDAPPPVEALPEAPTVPPAAAAAPTAEQAPAPAAAENAPAAAPAAPESPATPPADAVPLVPEQPAVAPDVAGATAPVPPAIPAPVADEPGALPNAGEPAETAGPPAAPPLPLAESAPPAPDLPAPPPLTPEEEQMLAGLAKPDAGNPPEAVPEPEPEPEPAPPVEAEPEMPEGATLPGEGVVQDDPARRLAVGGAGQSTLPSAGTLDGNAGIATDRLPRIGDAAAQTEAAPPVPEAPLAAFARPFENAAGKPMLAVILIDTGAATLDRAALAALPFPVTFALDPMAEGAADHAAVYRAAGQEVILLATGLPKGAEAADVQQAFQVMAQKLPEAVAVMDLPDRSFQASRSLSAAVVPVVGDQGRGLVTWDEGLNAADQVARREDVPAAVVFRNLDAEGETTPVIRRYLDRAAFKAAQEGRVTVVGQTRPETVAALLEWTVEGRAATVALAPVSAVLAVD